MRTLLRSFTVLFFISLTITALGYFLWYKPNVKSSENNPDVTVVSESKSAELLKQRLADISSSIRIFTQKQGYNNRIAFLIDMSILSGRKRFFIYNIQKDSIEAAGLVTHGQGSLKPGIEFSNVPGSYCTSLGSYKVGKPYTGRFGLAYKLYGLDKTNDKAFERFVVLHAHDCVPDQETDPYGICQSQGCPTVSPAFLQTLKKYIDRSDKPILMQIFKE
jgi:hypothetical protein